MTMAQIAERKALYRKIRGLSDSEADRVMRFVDSIAVNNDEEPLTEEDINALAKADEEIAAGRFYTLDEFNRRMAALP